MKFQILKFDPNKVIKILLVIIMLLGLTVVVQTSNLQEQRKQTVAQANFCVTNTADMLANYQTSLMREKDGRLRDIDSANKNIEFLVNEYNKLIDKTNKSGLTKRDHLSIYSYIIYPKS